MITAAIRLAVVVACTLVASGALVEHETSVKLTLFYQTFCGNSEDFIVDQLYRTWKHYETRLRVDIIPYGGAKWTYDLLEACAVYEACGPQGTLDCPVPQLGKAMAYLHCLEKKLKIPQHIKCAREAGLGLAAINECATGPLGEELKKNYTAQAEAVKDPPIHCTPYIQLNDKYNESVQLQAMTDLKHLIGSILDDQTANLQPSAIFV